MQPADPRKLIANVFNKLHEHLSGLRTHVESLDDPTAEEFLAAMEVGLLAPMRKLRLHLDIPYNWQDVHAPEASRPAA